MNVIFFLKNVGRFAQPLMYISVGLGDRKRVGKVRT